MILRQSMQSLEKEGVEAVMRRKCIMTVIGQCSKDLSTWPATKMCLTNSVWIQNKYDSNMEHFYAYLNEAHIARSVLLSLACFTFDTLGNSNAACLEFQILNHPLSICAQICTYPLLRQIT